MNRYATFEVKPVELGGPLVPGKDAPAKVRGTFAVRGKLIEGQADGTITYVFESTKGAA